MNKAIIIGATGAIGKEVFKQCVENKYYDKVYVYGRSSIENLPTSEKVEKIVIDFKNIDINDYENFGNADVFACLGTTIKQAGSKEVQREVDYQYTINFAKKCENKVKSFTIVSSLGTDRKKTNFYLTLKKELERDLAKLNIGILRIIRPSLLIAKREDRKLENVAMFLAPVLSKVLVGSLEKYKPVKVEKVAKSMVYYAVNNYEQGVYSYEKFID